MTPALKQCFVVSYVVLAPLVGAFADSMPKGRVMLITNAIKVVGCLMMLATLHPLARLRGGRLWRRRLLAGQVRHPDRTAAGQAAGRRQWLDRGHHRRLDRSGRTARRAVDRHQGVDDTAGLRPAADRHRHQHAAGICDRCHRRDLRDRRDLQLVHPAHGRRPSRREQESVLPHPRIFALRHAAVARQAGADHAGHHDAVLGRRRDAAVHRAEVGRPGARL